MTSLDTDRDSTLYLTDIYENADSIDKQAFSENDLPITISEGSEKPRPRKGHLSQAECGRFQANRGSCQIG